MFECQMHILMIKKSTIVFMLLSPYCISIDSIIGMSLKFSIKGSSEKMNQSPIIVNFYVNASSLMCIIKLSAPENVFISI